MAEQPGQSKKTDPSGQELDKLLFWLSSMSHEIRTPLNAIIGFSGLLMEGRVTREEQEDFSRLINRNSRRLLGIISNLTDLARIEAGNIRFFPSPTSIPRMLDDLDKEAQEIRLIYGERAPLVTFSNLVPSRKPVSLDWPRLFQVLVILLDNSIKFSDKGVVEVSISKTGSGQLQIRIADNGPGMDEDTLRDLYELFPVHATDDVKLKSRGLGMILVKRLCDLMEIGLETRSASNAGTTFTLTLPVRASET